MSISAKEAVRFINKYLILGDLIIRAETEEGEDITANISMFTGDTQWVRGNTLQELVENAKEALKKQK